MNEYLKICSARYPKNLESNLIHPISVTDAEIFVELGEILRKANLTKVKALLDKYKYLKDEKIRDALLQYNIDHPEGIESSTGDEKPVSEKKSGLGLLFTRNFIFFKDFRIDIQYIRSYEKQDEFDYVKGEMIYKIVINPLPETTTILNTTSNKTVSYTDPEQRDQDFELLDSFISSFPGIHFINER
jgi:hypothetical protein